MDLTLPFPARAFLPSLKTVSIALLLVAGAIIPHSNGQDQAGPVSQPTMIVADAGPAATDPVPALRQLANVIPDPVPVPVSWTAQPIVIDLK